MSNIINNENIDKYRESINGNYYESVKSTLLNILEVAYSNMLQNNQITEEMLDNISNKIVEDEEFNDYIDSMINNGIEEYIKENELEEENCI